MATTYATLSNSSYQIQLADSTAYGIKDGGRLGMPSAQRVFAEVWGKGFSPLAAIDYRNRQAEMAVHVIGTSHDNLITNYRQAEIIILQAREYWTSKGASGDAAYLSVQLDGMTNAIEYDVLDGELQADNIFTFPMKSTTAPRLVFAPLSLTLKPWGRPQALTRVTSTAISNGGGVAATAGTYSMAAPLGDVPAPVKVSLSNDTALNYGARYLLARRTVGNVANFAALWPMQCETGTYTGYTVTDIETSGNFSLANVAVAAASGGNVLRLTHANVDTDTNVKVVRFTINDNLSDFRGRFRVFLRVDTGHASVTSLSIKYGGTGSDIVATGSPVTPSWAGNIFADRLIDLGEIRIPSTDMPLDAVSAAFNFELWGSFTIGVWTADFDCLYLLPVDENRMDIRLTVGSVANDIFVNDNLGVTPGFYLTDSTGLFKDNIFTSVLNTRFNWVQGKANLLLPLAAWNNGYPADVTQHRLTDVLTIVVDGHPQYALLR